MQCTASGMLIIHMLYLVSKVRRWLSELEQQIVQHQKESTVNERRDGHSLPSNEKHMEREVNKGVRGNRRGNKEDRVVALCMRRVVVLCMGRVVALCMGRVVALCMGRW